MHAQYVNQFEYTNDFKFCVVNPCDPSWPIFVLSDAVHALKKGRNNVEKSGVLRANGAPPIREMEMDGLPINRQHWVDVFHWYSRFNSASTGLTYDAIYLNAWNRMRIPFAMKTFSPSVLGGISWEDEGLVEKRGGMNRTDAGMKILVNITSFSYRVG